MKLGNLRSTYSNAAPYIREQALVNAGLKLSARTQRDQRYYSGVMYGLISALDIMMRSDDTKEHVMPGRPKFRGDPRAIDEVKRYLGSKERWRELGFEEEEEQED